MTLKRSFEIVCNVCGVSGGHAPLTPGKPARAERQRLAKLGWARGIGRGHRFRDRDFCPIHAYLSEKP